MGAIRLATSNSTDEEYGGTFPLDASDIPYDANTTVKQAIDSRADRAWKGAGVRNFDEGTGDWNLSADISNASEVLLVVFAGQVVRTSVAMPISYIKNNYGGIDYMFAGNRNYMFFNYVSGTKLNVTASVNGQSTSLRLDFFYR